MTLSNADSRADPPPWPGNSEHVKNGSSLWKGDFVLVGLFVCFVGFFFFLLSLGFFPKCLSLASDGKGAPGTPSDTALLCVHVTCSGDPKCLFFKGQIDTITHFLYLGF